ncbi:MAG: hypothetical protein CO070_05325 [Gallionellales bacterium CG_4_9_14_0_8_um_filter_55_61]|nr:MAG: hypothetical protein CO070_05325 [Gallionellales bacterium CG_4_9_14_0_8_um_filter_55_61]
MPYSNLIATTKIQQRNTVILTLLLVVFWLVSVVFLAERHYLSSARDAINQETLHSQQRADDLADSIQRNLSQLHGIPDLLSTLLRVKWAVSRFDAGGAPSALPLEARRKAWTEDPAFNDLSRYLALSEQYLNADLVYVVNAAGDCIAASNWDTQGSSIGTNFAERDFFKSNKNGQRGIQYAMGKTTHIAGLYFSTPVIIDGKFMGAVVAKADVPNLSFLIKQLDAFVTDSNGVVILAGDKTLEMYTLPNAAIAAFSEQEKFARYRRNNFSTLDIVPWENNKFPSLVKFKNQPEPHLLVAKNLPQYGLQVYVASEVTAITSLAQNHFWLTLLIGALGSILICAVSGTVLYLETLKRSKALLWRKANFDALTELPNRELFHDRLEQEIKKSVRSGLPIALLLIDLDQFKEVNDTLGHEMGDLLLQQAANRIVNCVRATDTVARLGGDEFTVVLPQLHDVLIARQLAQKIINKLAEPFYLRDEVIHISASIGITLYPADATEIVNLMRNADQAMYAAKNEGRNRFSYFTRSLQEAAQKRLHLTNDLRGALANHQFRLFFQPIVSLATDRIHKAEALLRWQHPTRGMVSPADFIPLAEETRLIVEIGAFVRKESLAWCKRWNNLNPEGFQISVNKSPAEFTDENDSANVEIFVDKLNKMGLCGENFVFEITEGLLLNADVRIHEKLMELRDAGIQVSIDDFGTGYSSLSYLKKFDIDYLKIDQSFVRNLESDSNDVALCEAIIVMAHKLGLKVIAEGVETEQQRDLLSRAGCDYAQGYLYARPMPPEAFEQWLTARNA